MNEEYLKQVFQVLTNSPTQQDLDFLIEAYAKVGYLASDAERIAEDATNVRKYEEASEWLKAKQEKRVGDRGVSDETANKMAYIATYNLRTREAEAIAKAKKVSNLLDSLREAIHAVKFLGRYDSSNVSAIMWGKD